MASVRFGLARRGNSRLCAMAVAAALMIGPVLPWEAAFAAENTPAGCPDGASSGCHDGAPADCPEGAPAGCHTDTPPVCPEDPPLDYKIVPNCRIGPVTLTATISKIVDILGPPSRRLRDTYRDQNIDSDVITYVYKKYCLTFSWVDKGVRPKVAKALIKKNPQNVLFLQDRYLAMRVTCWRTGSGVTWETEDGLHVGSTIDDVLGKLQKPNFEGNCKTDRPECLLGYAKGIWFRTRNRKSPVSEISVIEKFDP